MHAANCALSHKNIPWPCTISSVGPPKSVAAEISLPEIGVTISATNTYSSDKNGLRLRGTILSYGGIAGHARQKRCGMPVEARADQARAASILKVRTGLRKFYDAESEEWRAVD